jgi:iron transport multicopper oxidase
MLLNDGAGADYKFEPGKRYRLRMIAVSALASFMVNFDSHDMYIIMNDASYVKKQQAKQLRISPAQRFDVIIESHERETRNFPFLVTLDQNADWTTTNLTSLKWPHNVTGHLIMDPSLPKRTDYTVHRWLPYDDAALSPHDGRAMLPPCTKTFVFDFTIGNDKFGIHR